MDIEASSRTRTDVYRTITDTIIAAIERGAGDFVMPWHGSGIARPQNALTRSDYHGINIIALWAEAHNRGFPTGWWATYRQWKEAGGQVRRDERASTIVFFKRLDEDQDEGEDAPRARLVARASRVFNADQVEGWTEPANIYPQGTAEVIPSVSALVGASGAKIQLGRDMACYRIDSDQIEMPPLGSFIGTPTSSPTHAYAATLLHELVHWTGAGNRLDRGFGEGFDKERLAAEELVAEIGAAYLCADLGVSNAPRPDHAAYVGSWLKLLKNDRRAIFTASRFADRAATYLHDLAAAA